MTIIITIILTVLTLFAGVGIFYLGYRHGAKSRKPQPKELTEEEKTAIREGERLSKYLNNVLNFKV